jgi:hypothetical protein
VHRLRQRDAAQVQRWVLRKFGSLVLEITLKRGGKGKQQGGKEV